MKFAKHRKINLVIIALFIIFFVIQLMSANIKNEYSFTPAQLDQQIQRMNYYQPGLARLGYILERKKEVRILDKLSENLVEVLDFNTYFPAYMPFVLFPFFLSGVYKFFEKNFINDDSDRTLLIVVFFSILIQSFFGVKGKLGPILLLPFIYLSTGDGFVNFVLYIKNKYEKKN